MQQRQTSGEPWLVQRSPDVQPAVMATAVVESLRSGSCARCEVTGMFAHNGQVQGQHQFTGTSNYIVYERSVDCGLDWQTSNGAGAGLPVCDVREIAIPNSASELYAGCFKGCRSLQRVTFGPSSSIERIGALCVCGCGLVEFEIPVSVRALGQCALTGGVVCLDGCCFRVIDGLVLSGDCTSCLCSSSVLSSVCVPDSVRELCDGCFKGCKSVRRVTFGCLSSFERVNLCSFQGTGVEDIVFPNGLRELCDCCCKWFSGLRCVPSGSPSQGGLVVRAFIQAPVCPSLPGIYNDDLCFSSLPISMSKLYSELLDILSLNIQEGCTEE